MSKESYSWYKEHGFCTRCCNEKAMPGKTICEDCARKKAEYARIYREKKKSEDPDAFRKGKRESRDSTREKRSKQGVCEKCGKHKPWGDRKTCIECTLQNRKINNERYRKTHELKTDEELEIMHSELGRKNLKRSNNAAWWRKEINAWFLESRARGKIKNA